MAAATALGAVVQPASLHSGVTFQARKCTPSSSTLPSLQVPRLGWRLHDASLHCFGRFQALPTRKCPDVGSSHRASGPLLPRAQASSNGSPQTFDYDLIIIGAGVGGHGAALHAVERVCIPCLPAHRTCFRSPDMD